MESAGTQGRSQSQHAAFGPAWERFSRLLQAMQREFAAGVRVNNQQLGGRLAAEFERWLQDPGSLPPWWQILRLAPSFVQPFGQTHQPLLDLVMRWTQLQAQLAIHWSAVARNAGERFAARVASSAAPLNATTIRMLYDEWIECAEQAYAATVHTEEFCRTQAELVNIMTALILQLRRQGESFAAMFGLATRTELDALRQQVKDKQTEPRPQPGRGAGKQRRRQGKAT
jgi:Poly(R)-hydroxyalkanoic acid synthase subunit (PHA_synth_III_E)